MLDTTTKGFISYEDRRPPIRNLVRHPGRSRLEQRPVL
jgi:hypothetical protein